MLSSIIGTLKTWPNCFWYVFGSLTGISLITTPFAIAIAIVNSGSIQWQNGQTVVNLQGKQLIAENENNTEKLIEQINLLIKSNDDLVSAAKQKKLARKLIPEIENAQQAAEDSKLRLEDAQSSQAELKDFVETAIAEPD